MSIVRVRTKIRTSHLPNWSWQHHRLSQVAWLQVLFRSCGEKNKRQPRHFWLSFNEPQFRKQISVSLVIKSFCTKKKRCHTKIMFQITNHLVWEKQDLSRSCLVLSVHHGFHERCSYHAFFFYIARMQWKHRGQVASEHPSSYIFLEWSYSPRNKTYVPD
jgi:hypothetical protein